MAKNIDLQMQKLLVIKKPFWQDLAVLIKAWILKDMISGKVQAITKAAGSAYSSGYRKYKMNYMKRFTTRTYKKGTKNIPAGTTTAAGTNLKAYEGQSIRDNSATPNMRLTGQTIDGLEYEKSTPVSLTMSYKEKDEHKIINNELLGRSITTLNEANQNKVVKQIEDELVKNISDWYRDKIIITIG